MNPLQLKKLALYTGCLALAFGTMVCGVVPLSRLVVTRYPENYDWQARTALERGEVSEAIAIARGRIREQDYDFNARRLLARALLESGDSSSAATVLTGSLDRAQTISWRTVHSRGLDAAADYRLLEQALRQDNHLAYAHEMQRAGDDAERLALSFSLAQPVDDSKSSATSGPPPSVSMVSLNTAKYSSGSTITKTGAINFSRRSSANIHLPHETTPGDILWLQVSGGRPMGFGALLKISINDNELIRVYADNETPRWVSVRVPEVPRDGTLLLTAHFLNDEFDPITKADRNAELLQVGVQHTHQQSTTDD